MTHPLVETTRRMRAALTARASDLLLSASDEDVTSLLVELMALADQVQELTARATAVGISRDLPRAAGASNPTAWLKALTRCSNRDASQSVKAAKELSSVTEETRVAWAEGQISRTAVLHIVRGIAELPDWCRGIEDVAQKELLVLAGVFTADEVAEAASRVVERIDPDQAEEHLAIQVAAQEHGAWENTTLTFRPMPDGMTRVIADVPTLYADMLRTRIEALASPRRHITGGNENTSDQDLADDRDLVDDQRKPTYPERLGRAFLELIDHLPTQTLPQAGGTPATVNVTISEQALRSRIGVATTTAGGLVSAGEARRIACNAGLVAIILNSESRVIDQSIAKRLHDRYQRDILAIRDGGCVWPRCDRPPSHCEAHHLTFYDDGGLTTIDNGALLCFVHHHLLHSNQGWEARLAPDNVVEIIPPTRIDPQRRPRRNTKHHPQHRMRLQT